MMLRRRKARLSEDVEQPKMTPFIDVTFQLLIFFMLTIRFKEIEGRLLTHLPKDQGLQSSPSNRPPEEVKIFLCLNDRIEQHSADKGRHDRRENFPDISTVYIYVQKERTGIARLGEGGELPPEVAAIYEQVARRAANLRAQMPRDPEGRPAPIKIDADSEVATQHVIALINELHAAGAQENVLFAGNPRLDRYFGER